MTSLTAIRSAAFSALAALTIGQSALRAADHGDSPVPSNNQEVDIADVYFFMDPNAGSTDNVILIATIRGFIAAGENSNFGIFDPAVRYHFEIETTGAPAAGALADTKPDKFIDITFSPREADPATQVGKENLQIPKAQTATIAFSSAFKGTDGKKLGKFTAIPTTGSSTAATAPAQVTTPLGTTGIKFFAGMVDDPFFFDIPATGAFIKAVREGQTMPPPADAFLRGRDSFAGYNVMSIALSIPKSLLLAEGKTKLGAAFYAQKHIVQSPSKKTGALIGTGSFKTLDRMGNPAVNVVLVPFNRKNEYNVATPKDDAKLRFAVDILKTLKALGTIGTGIDATGNFLGLDMVSGTALTLAQVAVLNGDYLRLDTAVANDGLAATGFPNGRRLADDVVDIELSLIANDNPFDGFALGDNVNASDPAPQTVFPFLALPNQPLPRGAALPAADTNVDDKTRN